MTFVITARPHKTYKLSVPQHWAYIFMTDHKYRLQGGDPGTVRVDESPLT